MKNIRINKFLHIVLSCILFIAPLIVFANETNETFKNSLLRVDFSPGAEGNIKISLYTKEPYKDPITVNKRSDYEYVILLPETSNSLTENPSFKTVFNIVRNVNIKTQPYEDRIKGYTKITILTIQPADIIPQIQTLSSLPYSLSENDYKELLEQTVKKAAKPVVKETNIIAQKPKNALKTEKQINAFPEKKRSKAVSRPIATGQPKIKSPARTAKIQTTAQIPEKEEKLISAAKMTETKPETTATDVLTTSEMPEYKPVEQQNLPLPLKQPTELQKYKNLIKSNVYIILGTVLGLFMLLLIVMRRAAKNNLRQKEFFKANLDEKPFIPKDYTEKINGDMNWKEKYQTYLDTAQEKSRENPDATDSKQELNELFTEQSYLNQEDFEKPADTPLPADEILPPEKNQTTDAVQSEIFGEIESPGYDILQNEDDFEANLEELFGEDEEETFIHKIKDEELSEKAGFPAEEEEEAAAAEEEEEEELIKSEFIIDKEKGFYLVDFEDTTALIGHIDEEIFVLKRFEKRINGPLQARLNERKAAASNYMTKVGDFKALVEVTPNNMNLLIEL